MTIYSSPTSVEIPTDQSLTELLLSSARPSTVADQLVVYEDDLEERKITLGQLRRTAGVLASALVARYNPPDQSRWALILPNSATITEAVHTVLWLGGVICPINHQLLASEMAHALRVSKPGYVIAYGKVISKVERAIELALERDRTYEKPIVITAIEGDDADRNPYPCLHRDFDSTAQLRLAVPHYQDTRTRLASIHLSSGTTGLPKGVGLSHHNYVANVYQLWAHDPERWSPAESVLSVTPFVHLANGTVPYFLGPWTGVRHVILSSYEKNRLGRLVERMRPTTVQMLPTILQDVVRDRLAARYDFSSVKRITGSHGGLKEEEEEQLFGPGPGQWQPMQMYGLTETGPWLAVQRASERLAKGQMGRLVPGLEARLMVGSSKEDHAADAPVGGPGELWVRGPNVTSHGYVDNPEANRTAFPEVGWFNTGDVCTISADGILSLVGRTKELIKYNGFQVSPGELEVYILQHPEVLDGAVGPTWDEAKETELPTAYIALRDSARDESEKLRVLREIQELVDGQVSGYKRLRGGVWEVSQIPRNSTSKILRRRLREVTTGLSHVPAAKISTRL